MASFPHRPPGCDRPLLPFPSSALGSYTPSAWDLDSGRLGTANSSKSTCAYALPSAQPAAEFIFPPPAFTAIQHFSDTFALQRCAFLPRFNPLGRFCDHIHASLPIPSVSTYMGAHFPPHGPWPPVHFLFPLSTSLKGWTVGEECRGYTPPPSCCKRFSLSPSPPIHSPKRRGSSLPNSA